MNAPLIRDYELELASPECHPGAEWYRACITLDGNIAEALPYLNAELGGFDYQHNVRVLLWMCKGRNYAFRPEQVMIAPVFNREEADELANEIVGKINDTWDRRSDITPRYEGRGPLPNTLEIYKLLPRTNCRECGHPTCMAFATALRNDPTLLPSCPYLPAEAYQRLVSRDT
ncbi:MAG: hypothetical protein IBX68_10455 [Dehalococcoidia bacterium]|nr:hypothetical protein [Dehalococcoidia bacterium]